MTTPVLPYGRHTIDENDCAAVLAVLRGECLTQGPAVAAFEAGLAAYLGAAEVVTCSSGTAALHLLMQTLELKPGEAVVIPAITFVATANAVRHAGGEVAFADVNPETGLMTPETAAIALARARQRGWRVRALCPVHLGGHAVDRAALTALADAEGLMVLEDACHALGSRDARGERIGNGACPAVFSFHPVKAIAAGEGGAVATNDPELAQRLRQLRTHGLERDSADPAVYRMDAPGFNYRLSDLHAALGLSQLARLETFVARRRALAACYDQALAPLASVLRTPLRPGGEDCAWHLYSVRIDFPALGQTRPALMAALRQAGIGTQVHYIPVHTQPYYQQRYGPLFLPGAEGWYAAALSLPLFPALSQSDAARVVAALEMACGFG